MGRLFSTSGILQAAVSATGNGEVFDCSGLSTLGVAISGTFVGTLTFQGRLASGTWTAIQAENLNSGVVGTTSTAVGLFRAPVAGLDEFRVPITWGSGTSVTVTVSGTIAASGTTLADVDIVVGEQVDIGDVSKGTQTNDVKVTLDSEAVVLGAGAAHIGQVAGGVAKIQLAPTVDTAVYAANEVLFTDMPIAEAAREDGGITTLMTVAGIDRSGQAKAFDLFFFDQEPTNGTYTINGAFTLHDTDAGFFVGYVNIAATDFATAAASAVFTKRNIGLQMKCVAGADDLYVIGVTRDTPDFVAATDFMITFEFLQD